MNKEIKLEDIEIYQNNYLANKNNVNIQKFIYTNGINATCFNYDLESKTKFDFNIEIPKVKMYNQRNAY